MPVSADLGPKLEKYVAKLIKSGRYKSKSEIIREGLRLLQERELEVEDLKQKIQAGIDSANAGRLIPLEQVEAEFKERFRVRAKAQKGKRAA